MSANNYLLVERTDKTFTLSDVDFDGEDGGGFYIHTDIKTLEETIRLAQDYMIENEVEYGIHFDL